MKNLVNRVQLIGHLGQDVETIETSTGIKLAKATLATSSSYYNKKGERVDNTAWHRLTAWGKTAELMSSLGTKGNKLAISGKISNNSYDDKNGVKHYTTEIVVDEFMVLTPKPKTPF